MPIISIIIPVYNVELFIRKCVLSCLNARLGSDTYEIILVDDGCTDHSIGKVKDLIKEHDQVVLFTQSNKGLSEARNSGLKLAKGEYVWFVDSDDSIAEESLSVLTAKIKEMNAPDMIAFGRIKCYDDPTRDKPMEVPDKVVWVGKEYLFGLTYQVCVQTYIYRRQFLIDRKLNFMPNVLHEDNEFTPRALFLAQSVYCLNRFFYFHYQRHGSIMHSVQPLRCYNLIRIAESLDHFREEYCTCRQEHSFFYEHIGRTMNFACLWTYALEPKSRMEFLRYLRSKTKLQNRIMRTLRPIYWLEVSLLHLSLPLFFRVYMRVCANRLRILLNEYK